MIMSMQTDKAKVRERLAARDIDGIVLWAQSRRSPQRVLYSLALDAEELIAWRAIEALGFVTGIQARTDLERVRDAVRRLFWLMNDESGGLGWRSPELIGEILVNVPSLIDEYGRLLPAYFREEPFERGTHSAVARVAAVSSEPFTGSVSDLHQSLDNPNAAIRLHAASTLWAINSKANQSLIVSLKADTGSVTVYDFDSGALMRSTVGQMVTDLMERTGASGQAA